MDLEHIFASLEPLEGSRTAVLHDLLPSVHQVPFKFFEKNIFPRIPQNIKPSAVLKRLERQRHIRDGRWSAFPSDPHTYSSRKSTRSANDNDEPEKENENKVFGRLHEVVTAIQECVTAQKRTTTKYMSAPDSTPVCSCDEKAGRPDAYFVLGTAPKRIDGRVEWRNIVTPAEFKLRDTREGLQDDVKKICWNMYQIMLEDPRRRFVLAFTIEDTMMRIWMGNRTEVIVSEPFNFITDHEKVTHFFLSQLYGREADLGIDTTMTIVSEKDDEIPRYDIKVRVPVKSKRTTRGSAVTQVLTYRTTRLINDDGARSFRGSGTRVWEVVPVVNGVEKSKDIHVLKDNWVDDDRQHEGDILKEIMDDSSLDKLAREELAALFLTPIAQGDVYIIDERDGQEKLDSTRGLATRKACIPANATTFSLIIPESYTSFHDARLRDSAKRREPKISDGEHENAVQAGDAQSQQSMVLFSDKHHHRIVFKEKCESLSKETSLHRVFVALFQITSGIAFMHTSGPGWVHRDLSAGNILRLPDAKDKPGEAKLSDLEYAKRLDEKSAHVIRTGTSNFMAVEVSQNAYLFNNEREEPKERKEAGISMADLAAMRRQFRDGASSDSEMSEPPAGSSTISEAKPEQPFFYNPLHDLESIWWISIYFVVNKETELAPKEPGVGTVKHTPLTEDQRVYARSLFYDWATRFMAVRTVTGSPLDKHLSSLPSHLSMISTELIDLRKKLVNHYMKIEEPGFVITKTVCQDLYGHFTKAFKKIARSLAKQDILVAPIKRSPNERLLRKNNVARSQESSEPSRAAKRRKVDSRAASSTEQRETVDGDDISKSIGSSSARTTRSKAKSARKGNTVVGSSRK